MNRHFGFVPRALVITLSLTNISSAQIGFGVDGNGNLFSFDVTAPGSIPINSIGNLGFTPEAIDFKPGTNQLYAIDIGATTTQLYTVNIFNGAATPTSSNFPSVGAGYSLTVNQRYGFDFNPSTHDGSGNFQIRLIANNNENLRINSSDGSLSLAATDLLIQPGSNAPFTDAAAYLNNVPNQATFATTLYDMDVRNNSLYTQNADGGVLTLVGPFGAGITVDAGIGFDIYTVPGDVDPTIGGDSAYAVLTRDGPYFLYQVNLTTGAIATGKLVGPVGSPSDFTGGFAIAPLPIPEPATLTLLALGLIALTISRRPQT